MGNVTSTIDESGGIKSLSSSTFAGAAHNITSSQTVIDSASVNFGANDQTISFSGANKSVNFETGTKVTYYDVPMFNDTQIGFNIGSTGFLDGSGQISAIFLPRIMNVDSLNASGDITAKNFIIKEGRFIGPLTGDVTGNLTGNVTGDNSSINIGGGITGRNFYTSEDGLFNGNLKGNVTGKLTGDVDGNVKGNLDGNVKGNVEGNVNGNLTGNVTGDNSSINIGGGITGGNFYTSEDGLFNGNLKGNVTGNLTGNVTGNVKGDVEGNVAGNLTGNVTGNITIKNNYSSGGGIKLGEDKWIIAENGEGQLCFYNLQIDSQIPLACIGGPGPQAGKLLPGKA